MIRSTLKFTLALLLGLGLSQLPIQGRTLGNWIEQELQKTLKRLSSAEKDKPNQPSQSQRKQKKKPEKARAKPKKKETVPKKSPKHELVAEQPSRTSKLSLSPSERESLIELLQ